MGSPLPVSAELVRMARRYKEWKHFLLAVGSTRMTTKVGQHGNLGEPVVSHIGNHFRDRHSLSMLSSRTIDGRHIFYGYALKVKMKDRKTSEHTYCQPYHQKIRNLC